MIRIALIGHGKMGTEIERVSGELKNISIVRVISHSTNKRGAGLTPKKLMGVDVCIDFSETASVLDNIRAVAGCGKNMVVGTTGWYDELPAVRRLVQESKIGLLYSPNFSLGMNLFFRIVAAAAQLMDKYAMYDIAIHELHHRGKGDSPSGTALALADIIIEHVRTKRGVLTETSHGRIDPDQLHVTSERLGTIVGQHRLTFDSSADTIEMSHTAKDRSGFALGALVAAEWLKNKRGLFTMKDVIST